MDSKIIEILYKLALKAYKKNEIPVSAVIVCNSKVIAKAYNKKNINNNALLHAEIICLQKVYKKKKTWNLNDCSLYVTLEPCDMCKQLIQESRIKNVYYIIPKSKINNKYNKTKYEQLYDYDKNFSKLLSKMFEKIRK